jgi:hypothetical protein
MILARWAEISVTLPTNPVLPITVLWTNETSIGAFWSPHDYTICKSALNGIPWDAQPTNCASTLTGWNTTATKSPDGIDEVHYYWVVPSNGDNEMFDQPNTCNLVDGVAVLFVRASMDRPSFCQATDIPSPAFHYGK